MDTGRYLIVRLSALGDVVFALESLAAIKAQHPKASVDWLVEDRASGLLDGHADVERLLVYPRRDIVRSALRPWLWPSLLALLWRHVRALRSVHYDAVIDLHGNFKSGAHVWLARARRKIGFERPRARELSWLATNQRFPLPDTPIHRADQALRLLEAGLGVVAKPDRALLPERAGVAAEARKLIATHPMSSGPLVCIVPGSSGFGAFKRWPTKSFRALIHALRQDGQRVVLSTGPGEQQIASELAEDGVVWLDGSQHGVGVMAEVMRQCAVVVAADSGPLHVAQAVATPCVALFGPKNPALYGPRGVSVVLRYPVPCAPCDRRVCAAPICVRGIPVHAVQRAVAELIEANA